MRRIYSIILPLLLLSSISLSARENIPPRYHNQHPRHQTFRYGGFSGGMMLHAGYLWGNKLPEMNNFALSAATKGIGGAIRFNFGRHLRIGTEGYSSSASFLNNGSYLNMGWGGLLIDFPFYYKRWTLFGGATIGGGGYKGVYMFSGNTSDWESETNLVYRKSAFSFVDPFVGAEYAVSQRIGIVLKADCLIPMNGAAADIPVGPRFYIGFMFHH